MLTFVCGLVGRRLAILFELGEVHIAFIDPIIECFDETFKVKKEP